MLPACRARPVWCRRGPENTLLRFRTNIRLTCILDAPFVHRLLEWARTSMPRWWENAGLTDAAVTHLQRSEQSWSSGKSRRDYKSISLLARAEAVNATSRPVPASTPRYCASRHRG